MTPAGLKRLIADYKGSRERLRSILRRIFSNPDNIDTYASFVFPNFASKQSPPFHRELINMLESSRNVAIAAPRGFAKTTTVDLVYASWVVVHAKKHFILIISDTYDQAYEQVNTLRIELESNPVLQWLYGQQRSFDHWRQDDFRTVHDVRVMARGMGMKIRGLKFKHYRPDLVIIDDLENDENVESVYQRRKLYRWVTRSVIPAMARDNSKVAIIGTVLHYDSLLSNALAKRDVFASWLTKTFRALTVDQHGVEVSLWPAMWSTEDLYRMRSDPDYEHYKGSIVFSQEYQNEPRSEDDAIIKREWLQYADRLPDAADIVMKVVTVDPAISKKDTADPTAKMAVALTRDENMYVYRIGNDRMSFRENAADMRRWYEDLRPNILGVETVAFQQAFLDVDELAGLPVEQLKPDADKIRRTMAVSRFFEAGRIFIVRDIENADLLADQVAQFPFGSHDDLVDALVYAVNMLMYGTASIKTGEREGPTYRPATSGLLTKRF